MKTFCIYKIICPLTNSPKYIGFTGNLKLRTRFHRCYNYFTYSQEYRDWKLYLKSKSVRPIIEVIENNIFSVKEAKLREMYWINEYKNAGYKLFNITNGGDTFSKEMLEKQSKSNSKKPILVYDKDNNFIAEFKNSKDCAKFLNVGHSLIRECKSNGWLVRHKYRIKNKE